MAPLSQRDKRTIRIAAVGILIYLVLFYGVGGWKRLETIRSDYTALLQKAQTARLKMERYENKILFIEKLKKGSQMEMPPPANETLVGLVSAAIQNAAAASGVKVGPVRESQGSSNARELASMQLEATGPVPGVMTLLHRLETLGYPLIVDSVQINTDPKTPGAIKLSLRLALLDFEHWKEDNRAG